MPLNTHEHHVRLTRTLHQPGGSLVIEGIAPDPVHYTYGHPPGIDVCIAPLAGGSAAVVLVSADLTYHGSDLAIAQLFRAPPIDGGWRVVGRIAPPEAAVILRYVDALLGLDGRGVRLEAPLPGTREVVVPADPPRRAQRGTDEGNRFGQDLVQHARMGEIGDIVGRDAEVAALIRITSKLTRNAACLVGPPGVGKTAVVEAFAVEIARGCVPPPLRETRILDVNLAFLAAGASYKNEFEGRFKSLLDQARSDPHTILFFDELHLLCAPTNDVSQMVKADLGRGRVRCIGATTNHEWRTIEADAALARRFQVIPVSEPTPGQTLAMLQRLRDRIALHHGVTVDDATLTAIIDLSLCYVTDRHLPDKAIDLLDEAAAYEALHPHPTGTAGETGCADNRQEGVEDGAASFSPQALDAAIQEAIVRGDYARAYALEARRRAGGQP
jgi:hypothetical protein